LREEIKVGFPLIPMNDIGTQKARNSGMLIPTMNLTSLSLAKIQLEWQKDAVRVLYQMHTP
jgi:hypothetical protein